MLQQYFKYRYDVYKSTATSKLAEGHPMLKRLHLRHFQRRAALCVRDVALPLYLYRVAYS